MFSSGCLGLDPHGLNQASKTLGRQVSVELVEALILVLIEKGVLTKNDALGVVRSVAEVQRGREAGEPAGSTPTVIAMLERLYASFDMLADRSSASVGNEKNVHHLRPPIYDGRPEFPRDD